MDLLFLSVLQVVDIMRVNVDKVLERDQKLSELDDRAGKTRIHQAARKLDLKERGFRASCYGGAGAFSHYKAWSLAHHI